jgi:hypothetical protein
MIKTMFLMFVTSANGIPLEPTVAIVPMDNKCTWEFALINAINKTIEAQKSRVHYHASCEPINIKR